MFEINRDKINEGRAAYNGGLTIQGLMERMEADYKAAETAYEADRTQRAMAELPAGRDEQSPFRRAEIDSKSFSIGFADGLLADFRRLAGKGGLRA